MNKKLLSIVQTIRFKEIFFILLIFFISRLVTWFLGYYSFKLLEPINSSRYVWNYVTDKKIDIWAVWDSGYYLNIADEGYSSKISTYRETLNQANYAFFPLYPLLIHISTFVLHSKVLAGIIISNMSLLAASFILFYLVKQDYDSKVAQYSLFYLYAFPTAFIFTSVYSEALFLALSLISFYFGKNNKYFLAGIFGFFAALTRNVGIFLLIPIIFFYIKHKTDYWNKLTHLIQIALIPTGTLLYALYVRSLTGEMLSIINIQSAWGRRFGSPIKYIFDGLESNLYQHRFTSIVVLLTLFILLMCFRYLKPAYSSYALILFLLPLFTGLTSMPRYILVIFPIYIMLGLIAKRNLNLANLLLFVMAITQGMMLVFWTSGLDLLM
ncbi:hypothetical protein A3K34_01690 [candidate division WWE3 bacterium RIFOXYC1_FULL_40_10]|uniref:Glycosyltransferase RgtA/B/C/D-like domain-containing protein n=1 Tax=candidate division WWE3 bacterium RIFOXYA2_FULL_46_9 TaxID=1802636 RepID=A0A1F4W2P4_UNCKA|nr:MAG: hypothetical protein A3K58_01690 [candidate division WWE3 bacterium RIFOXYB1_FULL_40_22]OGC61578.1 MAG: hypothetical protein A3K37_01690 [candidate division WWE3 bacterium RIFOXYA1_FULL_40_11]OGC63625.1 MAG: hypothetical protein A2264_04635 [candidate division WWE3 bacterium RIFOXYA2_FULL_46_9]OGC64744.1 MAG: hypothetical protein A2326_01760 [candidate division WWE3 bacterium RIFOXYB2_FULL_41_6]OGC65961.1 MAG: hypothetical protein A3K34_01690 [candidate division WWE3 bacterium RIFOXYC1_